MRKKRWMSIMLVFCMLLTLLPTNIAYADEADARKDADQVEEVQSDEDIAVQDKQVEEVEPDEGVAMQAEQAEEAEPDEGVVMQAGQAEEIEPDEGIAMQEEQVKEAEPDQGAAVEKAAEPAEVMSDLAASSEKIKKLELDLKPVTELRYLTDFAPISYSPSDKITLKDAYVYEGYNKKSGSRADSYQFYKDYTAVYEFETNSPKYSFEIYTSGIKINSRYIKDWTYELSSEGTLKIYVSYPSLEKQVRVTFKSRDKWSDKISSMYSGHNLDTDFYSVWLSYYEGLNQTSGGIGSNAAYDPTKDYSVCIYVAGRFNSAIISPDLTKDDVKINQGTIWKVAWDDDNSYTKIYVNFPRVEDGEYTVKAKNAEITNAAGEPVSKATAGTVLTVKLKDLDKMYAFEKWVVDDNSTDVKFEDEKSTTTTFTMPKGEVYISPATLWKTSVRSKKLTYTGEEQTGVVINPSYAGTLTGHKATEVGTYTATASLKKGYSWSDGTTEDKNIVWTIAKADRDGPRGLTCGMPTKEGANDGRIVNTTTEMEYRKVGTTTWIGCPDGEVTGLAPGDYEVRYKDTKSYNKSIALIYTVPIWGPESEKVQVWIDNGTPYRIWLPENATITITANPPEKGKEFDKWVPDESSHVKIEDEKSEVTKLTTLGGYATVTATYKEKEIPGAPKYDLYVINGQGSGQYADNRTVNITADPAPEGKEFDKWVVIEETVTVTDITKAKTTLRTKGVEGWVVATYKDIGSADADHTLTVVNGRISGRSNPGTFKQNESLTLSAKIPKNFDKWVVTSGSVEAILPNENAIHVWIITSDEDTTIEATYKPHSHTYGEWSKDATNHWHECTDPASCTDRAGSVKDKAGHIYDNAADTTCNVCGYVRTVTSQTPTPPSAPTNPEEQKPGDITDSGDSEPTPIKVTKVTVKGESKKIAAGKKLKLTCTAAPVNADDRRVVWKSSNKKYATVSAKGVVTTKKAGSGKRVIITATAKDGSGKKATYKISIVKHVVKSVKITTKTKTVKPGKKLSLKAKVTVSGKTANKALLWTSSNTKYATVSKTGVVKASKKAKGKSVKITARALDGSGKKATIKIKIK